VYLETERMILRDFTMDDLDDFHEIFSDPVVMKYTEPPYDINQSEKFLSDFCIKRDPKGGFAAVLKETSKVIGYVLFCSVDEPDIYEMGWIFNKNHWRKGYAYEICSKVIKYGFEDMELHKIYADTIDPHKSASFMEKLGMKPEGIQRKQTRSNDDEWCDLYLYAILHEDYCLIP